MEMKETVLKKFKELFGEREGVKAFFAPGRVIHLKILFNPRKVPFITPYFSIASIAYSEHVG